LIKTKYKVSSILNLHNIYIDIDNKISVILNSITKTHSIKLYSLL